MRQSELFFKTQADFPKDELAVNARFLIRANFIHKLMAGVYSFLPLGLKVRKKIIGIIREEMNALGANEMAMPALQPRSIWEATGRWQGSLAQIMYKFKDHSGKDIALGPTHEEVIAPLARTIIESYQELPIALYQFQTKFRDEPRAKSGILRGREFLMKDLYSFHADLDSLDEYYERVKKTYQKIFDRCGLKVFATEASGGDFSKEFSHEFMTEAEIGEDEIILCRLCNFAQNKEIAKSKHGAACPKCKSGVLDKIKAVEVGNIFKLGTKFSEAAKLSYKNKEGDLKPVVMASYGIGVDRLMGTIVETHHDAKGIIWPESIAPFKTHLLLIGVDDNALQKFGNEVYNDLVKNGVEVLYDDRDRISAGEKFFDADLIGMPWRIVISEKTFVQNKIEIKKRDEKETKFLKLQELVKFFNKQ